MNRILRAAALTACVGAMLCFVGCGGGTPESVAVKFYERLAADDFDGACKLCTEETAALLTMAKGMAKEDSDLKKLNGAKFEVVECKVDGDAATVSLKVTLKSGEVETMKDKEGVTLIKKDGAWKVNIKKD